MNERKYKMIWPTYPDNEVVVKNCIDKTVAKLVVNKDIKKFFGGKTVVYVKADIIDGVFIPKKRF